MLHTATATRASDLELQRRLSSFNHERLRPRLPVDLDVDDEELSLDDEVQLRSLEERFIDGERAAVAAEAARVPDDPEGFVAWFEALKETGPGQNDPLFAWLAGSATLEQLRWFLTQEVAGEAASRI